MLHYRAVVKKVGQCRVYDISIPQGQPWLVNALAYEVCFRNKTNRNRSRTINGASIIEAREMTYAVQEGIVQDTVYPALSGQRSESGNVMASNGGRETCASPTSVSSGSQRSSRNSNTSSVLASGSTNQRWDTPSRTTAPATKGTDQFVAEYRARQCMGHGGPRVEVILTPDDFGNLVRRRLKHLLIHHCPGRKSSLPVFASHAMHRTMGPFVRPTTITDECNPNATP